MELPYDAARVFAWRHVVAEADIDMLGHASNIAYVGWIQDAAVAHSADVGLGFDTYRTIGGVFVVRRHEIDYLRPASLGDVLSVTTWLAKVFAAKSERHTAITRADGEVLAKAVTTWGFVHVATGRPIRIPDEVRGRFGIPPRLPGIG